MSELNEVVKMLKNNKASGSDYIATVTRVENGMAYVRLTGSDIMDTPVVMSIDCKPGDKVRVRVNGGRAWITGNDTAPPTFDTENVIRLDAENKSLRAYANELNAKIESLGYVYSLPCTISANSSNIVSVDYSLYIIPAFHLAMLTVYCKTRSNTHVMEERILSDLPLSIDTPKDYRQSISVGSSFFYVTDATGYVYPGVMEHLGSSIYVSISDPYNYGNTDMKGTFTYIYSELDSKYPLSAAKKIKLWR